MKRITAPDGPAILISWVSVGAKGAPLLNALDEPSPLYRHIGKLYLLWRDAPGAPDREAVAVTRKELHQALDPFHPEIVERPWTTTAAPTDHDAIRRFVEQELKEVRAAHPSEHLFIHLSPGTPAMHAVWLVLGATGFVDGPLTMIQSTPSEKRAPNASPIQPVPVVVDNWLRRYRGSKPVTGSTTDDGNLWEPVQLRRGGRMRDAVERLLNWASVPAPVLLLGERGTGKSSLANVLRAAGPFQRQASPGVPVTTWPAAVCGQFRGDPQLTRSELFGHAQGAFTGADASREGLLTQADGDCLFLDEIADLDRDTQRQLMHAVEGRGYRPLGGNEHLTSNFRLISATNRTLDELANGLLDPDFFDRVSTFTLTVPPLRECREDLPIFWRRALAIVTRQAGVAPRTWEAYRDDGTILDALHRHPLPGNLRDLHRVAWHLVVALNRDLPVHDAREAAVSALRAATTTDEPAMPTVETLRRRLPLKVPLPDQLETLRHRWVEAALAEAAGGSPTEAAKLLGVPRETFNTWNRSRGGGKTPT